MAQLDLLRRAVDVLDDIGVDFMLTGSFASSMQGEPRSTHDIDLVVELSSAQANRILAAFDSPDFYLSAEAVKQAVQCNKRDAMFNLVELNSDDKIDFWMLSDDPFDLSRFVRRRAVSFEGMNLFVSSPEDTILMKLRWASESAGSEKQMNDVRGVYALHRERLDQSYLEKWAEHLGVREALERVRHEAS